MKLKKRGFFLVAGDPGLGKSTSVQLAFPKNWTIATGTDVLHYYQTRHVPEGSPEPVKTTLIDEYGLDGDVQFDAQGNPIKIDVAKTFENLINQGLKVGAAARSKGVPPPFDYIVIDEGGELWDWVFAYLKEHTLSSSGAKDTRRAYGELGDWSVQIGEKLKRLKAFDIGVCVVTHSREASPSDGAKERPQFPSQTVSGKLTAKADGLLLRKVEDREDEDDPLAPATAHYYWSVTASQHSMAKLRGLRPEDRERVKEMELPDILDLAGWR